MISLSLLISAFLLGLLALPHCASMCACQFAVPWLKQPLHFQLGRLLAYVFGGVLAGGVSSVALGLALGSASVFRALNWMLMALLLFSSVLLIWKGRSLNSLVQQRIQLPKALQLKLGKPVPAGRRGAFTAGVLWLMMPCGVLWAALMLAYLSASPFQGGLIMAVFGFTSGVGLQAANRLRLFLVRQGGEVLMLRASGGLILLGLVLMLGRQTGVLPNPAWLQATGLCL